MSGHLGGAFGQGMPGRDLETARSPFVVCRDTGAPHLFRMAWLAVPQAVSWYGRTACRGVRGFVGLRPSKRVVYRWGVGGRTPAAACISKPVRGWLYTARPAAVPGGFGRLHQYGTSPRHPLTLNNWAAGGGA